MCNDYEQHVARKAYCEMMQLLEWGVPAYQSEADLLQADDIRITDLGSVMCAAGESVRLVPMSFGFPPPKPRASPVFNFGSEGRSFANSNRCLIPASAFFEFTGHKSPKTKHRFTLNDAPLMAIAGIWHEQRNNQPAAFTMLTTAPGPDVQPFHNRQIAVLRPRDWKAWSTWNGPKPNCCDRSLPALCMSRRCELAATEWRSRKRGCPHCSCSDHGNFDAARIESGSIEPASIFPENGEGKACS
jgi:putative SOS response-associated peptidase YedK